MTSVALLGVQQGIMIAVSAPSKRLRREYQPPDAVLLRRHYADWAEDRLDASHKYSSRRTASSFTALTAHYF